MFKKIGDVYKTEVVDIKNADKKVEEWKKKSNKRRSGKVKKDKESLR